MNNDSLFKLGAVNVCLFASAVVSAQPLPTLNHSPFTQAFGIMELRDAQSIGIGNSNWQFHGSLSNHFSDDDSGDEEIFIDGESAWLALRWRYGFGERWEVEATLPWMRHSGGQLDSVIEDWHDFFGLPNGNREDTDQDELNYYYQRDGVVLRHLQDSSSGAGEPRITLNYALWSEQGRDATLRGSVKLGTGDEDEFLGSGATDVGLAIAYSDTTGVGDWPVDWHAQLGVMSLGDSDLLPHRQRSSVWFGSAALNWRTWESLSLVAQVDIQQSPYRSAVRQLGDEAVQLSIGANWRIDPRYTLQFGFSEDIAVDTAPDISFFAVVSYSPGKD